MNITTIPIEEYNQSLLFFKVISFLNNLSKKRIAIAGIMTCNSTSIILESLNLLYNGIFVMKKSLIPPGSFEANNNAKIEITKNGHFNASFKNTKPNKAKINIKTPK